MGRRIRKLDRVHVYASVEGQKRGDKPLKVLSLVPYSHAGFDSYEVDGVMLKGFVATCGGEARVFLDRPHFGPDGRPA